MPKLKNVRHEEYSRLRAMGRKPAQAHMEAGYKSTNSRAAASSASALSRREDIKARIVEIEESMRLDTVEDASFNRQMVVKGLMEVIDMATKAKPVLDRNGDPTGEYKLELAAANRAYELLGKEMGMFKDRLDIHTLDSELASMTPEALRQYVKALATEVGLRVVEATEDEQRAYICRTGPRLGLVITDSRGEDPARAAGTEDRDLQTVPEATGVSPAGAH